MCCKELKIRGSYSGVIPALLTPFDEKGRINIKGLNELVEFHLRCGVSGFYVTGSTGEGPLMSSMERCLVTETVVNKVAGQVPVISHVGTPYTNEAISLSQSAVALGVDAISSTPPYYYPFSEGEITEFYRQIAGAVDVPFFVYNIPSTTNVDMSLNFILNLLSIGNIYGLKYTSLDTYAIGAIRRQAPEAVLFAGADETALYGLMQGADGVVGSSYNVLADLFVAVYTALKRGDYKRGQELFTLGNTILETLQKYPYMAALKECLNQIGVNAGYPRAPFKRLTADEKSSLFRELRSIGERCEEALAIFEV